MGTKHLSILCLRYMTLLQHKTIVRMIDILTYIFIYILHIYKYIYIHTCLLSLSMCLCHWYKDPVLASSILHSLPPGTPRKETAPGLLVPACKCARFLAEADWAKEKSLSSRGNSFGAIARNCLDNSAWLCERTPTEREGVHIIQKPIDPGPWRTVWIVCLCRVRIYESCEQHIFPPLVLS